MRGTRYLDVIVGDERHSVKWNQPTKLRIGGPHTEIVLWQQGDGLLASVKLTELDVSPGDHIRLRASWLPGRTLVIDDPSA